MNNDTQELTAYIDWLVQANQRSTTYLTLVPLLPVYLWGTVSEVYEMFAVATDFEKQMLEAGDVVAYATLVLHAFGESTEAIATNYNSNTIVPNVTLVLGTLTNALAKYYRGDEGSYREQAIAAIYNMVHWAATVSGVSVYILSIYNQNKLQKRLESTGTFKGSGDR